MPRKLTKNWILAYNEAISRISPAPVQFNIWAAISVISSVLKNHVSIPWGSYVIQPNQFIIFVAPPGIGKGSAIHPAYEFPKELKLVNTISDRVTAQRIIQKLSEGWDAPPTINYVPMSQVVAAQLNGHKQTYDPAIVQAAGVINVPMVTASKESACTIISAELQTFLSSSEWMTQFLCDAWDRRDFEYDTKNSGTHIISGMCVNLIGACVPAYIQSINKQAEAAITGGFTARSVFVYADKPAKEIIWPEKLEDIKDATGKNIGKDLIARLKDDLLAISNLRGEFTFSKEAKDLYETFYKSPAIKHSDSDSDVMQHFKSRMHVHLIKVAMAMSAADNDRLVIDRFDMMAAIDLVKQIQANLDKAFRGVGNSPLAEATTKILTFIEKRGAASKQTILKYNYQHVTREDLGRILYTLCEMGVVLEKSVGGEKLFVYLDQSKTVNANLGDLNAKP